MANAGRPKGDNNKEYNYSLRIDEHTKRRLEEYCKFFEVSKSEAIREAIMVLTDAENKKKSKRRQENECMG